MDISEDEQAPNIQPLLVGLSRFRPGDPRDTVVFGPRIPARCSHEATGREEE